MSSRFQISPILQKRLREANLTAEEVIRKALDIKPEGFTTAEGPHFPEGTAFLAWYKDEPYTARVKDGSVVINGEAFTSLSGAAAKITGRATTNGWDFWGLVKMPNRNEFVALKELRTKAK